MRGIIIFFFCFPFLLSFQGCDQSPSARVSEKKPAAKKPPAHDHSKCDGNHGPKKPAPPVHDHSKCDGDHGVSNQSLDKVRRHTIGVSPTTQKNLRLQTDKLTKSPFHRYLTVPGRIIDLPGHSRYSLTARIAGIITEVTPQIGESVSPEKKLFTQQITQTEVIDLQRELLKLCANLEVVESELKRLEKATASGAISMKTLLESQYSEKKLASEISLARQSLLVYGFTEKQVDQLIAEKKMISHLEICANTVMSDCHKCLGNHLLQVADIPVRHGGFVEVGTPLAVLDDYCALAIEGSAFEQDGELLNLAMQEKRPLIAMVGEGDSAIEIGKEGPKLTISFLASRLDEKSRLLRFLVPLQNEKAGELVEDGRKFVTWKYKPGQWVKLLVPTTSEEEKWVLPSQAVVKDGGSSFVFITDGEHFSQVEVVEQFRDEHRVVLEDSTPIPLGTRYVTQNAYLLMCHIKNEIGKNNGEENKNNAHVGCNH